jgi:hypothetical protein
MWERIRPISILRVPPVFLFAVCRDDPLLTPDLTIVLSSGFHPGGLAETFHAIFRRLKGGSRSPASVVSSSARVFIAGNEGAFLYGRLQECASGMPKPAGTGSLEALAGDCSRAAVPSSGSEQTIQIGRPHLLRLLYPLTNGRQPTDR